jgi:leucyl aminopeptidase
MLDVRIQAKSPQGKGLFICRFFEDGKAYHADRGIRPDPDRPEKMVAGESGVTLLLNLTAMRDCYPDEARRSAAGSALRHARRWGGTHTVWMLDGQVAPEKFEQLLTAALLSDYEYTDFKSGGATSNGATKLTVVAGSNTAAFREVYKHVANMDTGVRTARNLANRPPNDLPPLALAAFAKQLAKDHGLSFKQIDAKQLASEGYVGLTGVGQGSANPPVMFSLAYKPVGKTAGASLCLVGKGITFDTGGISIKGWDGMWDMKADMGGAAAVLGAMQAIALLKPTIPVTGVVASAENMPDGNAYRPGDVLRYRNGKTVEIHSTDAEGRLVLADALIYAQETLGLRRIVEMSTLTGACARALGRQYIGLMSKSADFVSQIQTAANETGELCWELPLHPEYRAMLKSNTADVKNVGGAFAGAQTAGMFLYEFIEPETTYAHLDIAGVFLADKIEKYWSQPGATGAGVRLCVRLAEILASPA